MCPFMVDLIYNCPFQRNCTEKEKYFQCFILGISTFLVDLAIYHACCFRFFLYMYIIITETKESQNYCRIHISYGLCVLDLPAGLDY